MSQPTVEEVANAMFELVKSTHGKKNLKAMDLIKAMIEQFGEDNCDKKTVQAGDPPADRLRSLHLQLRRRQLRHPAGEGPGPRPRAASRGPASAGPLHAIEGIRARGGAGDGEMAKGRNAREPRRARCASGRRIERKAIDSCAEIMEKTDNPLIRQIMEIIRNDSVQHHRVQQFIIDSLTKERSR